MRVRLIYRKDLHTSEVGTIELDSPGPLVAVHTDGGTSPPLMEGSCVVYGLSYHCHEQRCKCGEGDKISLARWGGEDKVSLVGKRDIMPAEPDRVRTIGEAVAAATTCTCGAIASMGRELDRAIIGALDAAIEPVEAIGTVYDERDDIKDVEPVTPSPLVTQAMADEPELDGPVQVSEGDAPTPVQPFQGASIEGTMYDERADTKPVQSKSIKKRLAVQSRGRAKRKRANDA